MTKRIKIIETKFCEKCESNGPATYDTDCSDLSVNRYKSRISDEKRKNGLSICPICGGKLKKVLLEYKTEEIALRKTTTDRILEKLKYGKEIPNSRVWSIKEIKK